jgi:hypothetical protein
VLKALSNLSDKDMQFIPKRKTRILILVVILVGSASYQFSNAAGQTNGFDLSNATLPSAEIMHGGPPRDGIPALSNPKLIKPGQADYLSDGDRIVGITINGQSRAYPIGILNWHEIVNDKIDNQSFAITYCPLCGTAVAFDASINGQVTEFGVSGLLYNSDVLLYDRQTESLWSQIMQQSIAGKRVGQKLRAIPISHTSWRDWLNKHPNTLVMSDDTGFSRDYQRDPYSGYETSRSTYFAVNNQAPDNYHPKELVMGIEVEGVYKAYPFVEMEQAGRPTFTDTVNGRELVFNWDSRNRAVTVFDTSGKQLAGIQGFWFAWFAFHPETSVFKASDL